MGKVLLTYFDSREDWAEFRRGKIGASEVGAIVGVSHFATPWQIWNRHVTGEVAGDTLAMKMGHMLEPIVADLYGESSGDQMIAKSSADFCVTNSDYPFAVASPDRYFVRPDGAEYILECKTTALRITEETLPRSWYCQLQYQLAVTEKQEGVIAWLSQGREFDYLPFRRNDEFISWLMARVAEFSESVKSMTPPPVGAADVDNAFPRSKSESRVVADPEDVALLGEYRQLRDKMRIDEERLAEISAKIKLRLGENEVMEDDKGRKLVSWKNRGGVTHVDAKKLKEINSEIYAECLKTSAPSRFFKVY